MVNIDIETLKSVKMLDRRYIESITPDSEEELIGNLHDFIDTLQPKLFELTRLFSVNDGTALRQKLAEFAYSLNSLGAKTLAKDCCVLSAEMESAPRELLESGLQKLHSELFTLSLDIQTAGYKTLIAKAAEPKKPRVSLDKTDERKTVLAVDDMPVVLNNLKSMIDDKYIFHGLSSAKGALRYLQTHEPDLIILDIEMPDMDGYELFGKIRDMGNISPIVFLTSNATQDCVVRAVRLGCAGFLAKPTQSELVLEKLKELLD